MTDREAALDLAYAHGMQMALKMASGGQSKEAAQSADRMAAEALRVLLRSSTGRRDG